jgi:hypothetical protein
MPWTLLFPCPSFSFSEIILSTNSIYSIFTIASRGFVPWFNLLAYLASSSALLCGVSRTSIPQSQLYSPCTMSELEIGAPLTSYLLASVYSEPRITIILSSSWIYYPMNRLWLLYRFLSTTECPEILNWPSPPSRLGVRVWSHLWTVFKLKNFLLF